MTLEENTSWATLTANWAVRVRFVDDDGTLLKEDLVPVSDSRAGTSSAPADPTKAGYQFAGWVRIGGEDPNVTLHDNGMVSDVTGPGPIVYQATYIQPTGSLIITKKWDDQNNRAKVRPSEVTVVVSTQYETVGTYTLSEGNGWQVKIAELPRYDETGETLHYNVQEVNPPKNHSVNYFVKGNRVTITNRYIGRIDYMTINDYEVPLANGYNMNEGDCFD